MNYNEIFAKVGELKGRYHSKSEPAQETVKKLLVIHSSLESQDDRRADILMREIHDFIAGQIRAEAICLYNNGLLEKCFELTGNPCDLGHYMVVFNTSEKLKDHLLEMGAIFTPGGGNYIKNIIERFSPAQVNKLYGNHKSNEWAFFSVKNYNAISALEVIVEQVLLKNPAKYAANFLLGELSYLNGLYRELGGVNTFVESFFSRCTFNEALYAALAKADDALFQKVMSVSISNIYGAICNNVVDLKKIPRCEAIDERMLLEILKGMISRYQLSEAVLEKIEWHYKKFGKGSILDHSCIKKQIKLARSDYLKRISPLNESPNETLFSFMRITPYFESQYIPENRRIFSNSVGLANLCVSVLISNTGKDAYEYLKPHLMEAIKTEEFVLGYMEHCLHLAEEVHENIMAVLRSIIFEDAAKPHLAKIDFDTYQQINFIINQGRFYGSEKNQMKIAQQRLRKVNWEDPKIKKSIFTDDLSF